MGAMGRPGVRALSWYLDGDEPPQLPAAPRPTPPPAPLHPHRTPTRGAEAKARALLESLLSPQQLEEWRRDRCFWVSTPAGSVRLGRLYQLHFRPRPAGRELLLCVVPLEPSDIRCPRPTCGPTCSSCCTTIPGASSPPPTGGTSTAAAGGGDRPRFRYRQARRRPGEPSGGVRRPGPLARGSARVAQRRVPVVATRWSEVEKVPDRRQEVDAPLADLLRHPRMTGVEVADAAVRVAGEDGDGRVLAAVLVLALEVVFERARARAQQPEAVPTAAPA